MNVDDKIKAKIESIDKKMVGNAIIDQFKLQSCARDLGHMGSIGHRNTCDLKEGSIKTGNEMIEKLMLLQVLSIFEKSITNEPVN